MQNLYPLFRTVILALRLKSRVVAIPYHRDSNLAPNLNFRGVDMTEFIQ